MAEDENPPHLPFGKGYECKTPYLCAECGNHDTRYVIALAEERKMYCPECDAYVGVGQWTKVQ